MPNHIPLNSSDYKTAFGILYKIQYDGRLARTGDNEAVGYHIKNDGSAFAYIKIKVSGSLFATWEIDRNDESLVENTLISLGTLKVSELLEDDEIHSGNDNEFMFTSYNSASPTFQEELARLTNNLDTVVQEHKGWLTIIAEDFNKNQELILNTTKEHVNFQDQNAREIRNSLLQLISLSAIIIAAIVALGKSSVGGHILVLIALALLGIVIVWGVIYIFSVLESKSIKTFDSYKGIIDRLTKIKNQEYDFLQKPSAVSYKRIYQLWEEQRVDILASQTDLEIKKDNTLKHILWIFAGAMIALILSFIAPGV